MLKSKQIEKILAAQIKVSNFSANGSSSVVTTALTSALSTAGNGGVSVPLQVSANVNSIGVVVANLLNRVELYGNASQQRLETAGGDEIYAKLTEAAGAYTLSYFVMNDAGTETAHTFASVIAIDFKFPYRFDFARLPADAITNMSVTIVDPVTSNAVAGAKWVTEKLAITATNAIAAMAKNPTASTNVFVIVNEVKHNGFGGASADFAIAAKTITWSPANAGYSLETTDDLIVFYETNEL